VFFRVLLVGFGLFGPGIARDPLTQLFKFIIKWLLYNAAKYYKGRIFGTPS